MIIYDGDLGYHSMLLLLESFLDLNCNCVGHHLTLSSQFYCYGHSKVLSFTNSLLEFAEP